MRTDKRVGAALLAVLMLSACASAPEPEPAQDGPEPEEIYVDSAGRGAYNAQGTMVEIEGEAAAINPLTGLCGMAEDRAGLRPYAVFVNNLEDCLPQYGISKADVILEMQTEGGITRYMCLFDDLRDVSLVGPVRSLRYSFVEATSGWSPLIINFGAPCMDVMDILDEVEDFRTLDVQFAPDYIWYDQSRDQNYAYEHNWFFTGSMVDEAFRGMLVKPSLPGSAQTLPFAQPGEEAPRGSAPAAAVSWDFSRYCGTEFLYNEWTGQYLKWQFGQPCVDAGYEGSQLAFDNLLILFCRIEYAAGRQFSRFQFAEGGDGWYLSRGGAAPIHWEKGGFDENFRFTAADGAPLEINRGKTYLAVVDQNRADTLEISAQAG